MQFGVVSLFPEMFDAITKHGVSGRGVKEGLISVACWSPRDFAYDKHRTVDDRPYGGGPGMLMKVQPLKDAIHAAKAALGDDTQVVYLSPQGRRFDHSIAQEFVAWDKMILVAGRYEGIDERLIETEIDAEISLGDFVLSGGELPAMAIIDAVSRLVPGVLGHQASAVEDSFADGLLDCPHYTRPEAIDELRVPDVLLSGNHEEIRRWRLKQQLGRTYERRPELLDQIELSAEQQKLLTDYIHEAKTPDGGN
ncbi:tRNA (guanosine(37)-N1)-methyltransferase TrmD [Neptunomonas sp. XY-337]|uniref:tRNA (guanosine(37)-N1)-methyltransferase TrmD n=1 Tax=Neptunomonas sp. XY-337 TaxID=2561897 RepID=UPI0010A9B6F5|nr:tRNA (guanosine(37)-N1)-methyltransferase TrmD [Neptunomonas sp. XY-337]